ncbi:hypothetical protein C819_00917 [Lachnospiraceae bacterium 10-1]|nr:hypothetical protein C819_00917 [Lachnospiraceae bacterium 10-1]
MWNIQLKATAVKRWLDEIEEKITKAGDLLDIMTTEGNALNAIWESSAGEVWRKEYTDRLNNVKAQLMEINKCAAKVGRLGKGLADLEIKLTSEAKSYGC